MSSLMSPSWVSVPIRNSDGEIIGHTPIRYDQFVRKLWKVMSYEQMIGHAGRLIASEAGEINGVLKKHLDYEQELNIKHLIEELGDLRFGIMALQNLLGITDDMVLQENANKLSERYLNLEYSDEQAKFRRDKNGTTDTPGASDNG